MGDQAARCLRHRDRASAAVAQGREGPARRHREPAAAGARTQEPTLHRISVGPDAKFSWAKQRCVSRSRRWRARGEPDVSVLTEQGGKIDLAHDASAGDDLQRCSREPLAYAEVPDMLAIEAWRNKDALIKQLDGRIIDAESDDAAALMATERAAAHCRGDGRRIGLRERDEAALTWRAVSEQLPVWFRADIAPQAVLGIALVTTPRAIDGPTTSLAYDIVHPWWAAMNQSSRLSGVLPAPACREAGGLVFAMTRQTSSPPITNRAVGRFVPPSTTARQGRMLHR